MKQIPDRAPQPSPWLSVWFTPRTTIERVVAGDSKRHVLLLAALGTMSYLVGQLLPDRLILSLLDWRVLAGVAVVGAAIGLPSLYIGGLVFGLIARMLGSRATAVQVRAALAWGQAPRLIIPVVCLIALAGLKLGGHAETPDKAADTFMGVLQVIVLGLGLWWAVATMLMLGRATGLGFWRTILAVALASLLSAAVAVAIRTFLAQPFEVPTASMQPTFLVGDKFFVSKLSYGYTNYSFPFSPRLFSGRIFPAEPDRGDVAVFRLPTNDSVDYVKRIVGLPGERIQMIGGVAYINGQAVKRERIDDFVTTNDDGSPRPVRQWRETLPNGASFATLEQNIANLRDTPVYTVPAGHYFVLGDNRDNSVDSRDMSQVGFVPFEYLVGRAQLIFFSVDRSVPTRWPTIRVERTGMAVR